MSYFFKFILPLLDENLTKDDIEPEAGFVDMYSKDINRPYLDNHYFLLYKNDITTTKEFERDKKFKDLKTISGTYFISIKGIRYKLYAFTVADNTIRYMSKGSMLLSSDKKLRIYKFWNFTDDEVNEHMCNNASCTSYKFEKKILPEQDYLQKTKARLFKQNSRAFAFLSYFISVPATHSASLKSWRSWWSRRLRWPWWINRPSITTRRFFLRRYSLLSAELFA